MVFVFGEEERLLQSHLVKIELVNPVQQVCNYAVSKCTVSVYMQASQFKGAELAMFKNLCQLKKEAMTTCTLTRISHKHCQHD